MPDVWLCDHCQEVNDEARERCPKCGYARHPAGPLAERSLAAPPEPYPGAFRRYSTPLPASGSRGLPFYRTRRFSTALVYLFVAMIVLLPIIYGLRYLYDLGQIPQYRQDCAATTGAAHRVSSASLPCHAETAYVDFERQWHYRRYTSGYEYDASLRLADGRSVTERLAIKRGDWTALRQNHECWAEVWRNRITRIAAAGLAVDTYDNPVQRAANDRRSALSLGLALLLFGAAVGYRVIDALPSRRAPG